jgi:hypothetical protein
VKTKTDPETGLVSWTLEPADRRAFATVADACGDMVDVGKKNAATQRVDGPSNSDSAKMAAFCRTILHENPPPPPKPQKPDPAAETAAGSEEDDG